VAPVAWHIARFLPRAPCLIRKIGCKHRPRPLREPQERTLIRNRREIEMSKETESRFPYVWRWVAMLAAMGALIYLVL
jgi:hypothetical protein